MTSSPEFDQGLVSPASSTGYEGPTGDHLLTAALAALPQMTPKRLRALLRCAPATQLCADLSTVDMAAPSGTPRRDWRQLLLVWARDMNASPSTGFVGGTRTRAYESSYRETPSSPLVCVTSEPVKTGPRCSLSEVLRW